MADSISSSSKQVSDDIVRRFEPARAVLRPRRCYRERDNCWVRDGAKAMRGNQKCFGCGDDPSLAGNEAEHAAALRRCMAAQP